MRGSQAVVLAVCLAHATLAAPQGQVPLRDESGQYGVREEHVEKKRPLYGRFLHITDFHPDRFYRVYTSTAEDSACHRGQGPAGIYGAEMTDCDSPVDLINKTMAWVESQFKDNIDFVIWTGDSARHDNDDDLPRSESQVLGLNQLMVQKMVEVFGKRNGDEDDDDPNNDFTIPIIPTFGNNDILPHNIITKGPNKWTRAYAKLWRQFIPEAQKHQFEQGGWFYVEVIPNKLAVFSLNTLYFFSSNAAADGCAIRSEPGYQHMEWLRIQLQFMRQRGMKAILTGHVPPARQDAKTSWEETCWQKYTLWLRQYRDVIVSSHYGHFNYDHFVLQDFEDLRKGTQRGSMPDYATEAVLAGDDDFGVAVSSSYFIELRDDWSKIPEPPKSLNWPECRDVEPEFEGSASRDVANRPLTSDEKRRKEERKFLKKVGGKHAERYAASFVASSVVPNLFPTIRVFEYNISQLESSSGEVDFGSWEMPPSSDDDYDSAEAAEDDTFMETTRTKKRYKFKIPEGPSKSAPPGPAYSAQTFSLIRYTQYLANLTRINNDFLGSEAEEEEEAEEAGDGNADDQSHAAKWHQGKHKGKKPHDKDHTPRPKKFKFELHYDTRDDEVYRLKDLTMPNLVDLARRIGDFVPEKDESEFPEGQGSVATDEEGGIGVESKKKKHRKEKEKEKRNAPWYAFVQRAYVETLDPDELDDQFGNR